MDVCRYNIAEGLLCRDGREKAKNGDIDPIEMMNRILDLNHSSIMSKRKLFLLEHFDTLLENRDPLLLTKLRLINDYSSTQCTVILIGRPYFRLPEIIEDIPNIVIPSLKPQDIQDIVHSCEAGLSEDETILFVEALAGLTSLECENLLALCLAKENKLDIRFLTKEKRSLLYQRARGLIELCEPEGDLSLVGGLDSLKYWLSNRGKFINRKGIRKNKKIPDPKGVLLTGPPGCGKSFLVSSLAGSWKVNLIKLDPSRLFSSFVGQTEQNFLTALETVKSLAPAILWIDEFEKLFSHLSNTQSDGGVLSRVLGLFLDFLHSKREGVFVCATTNSIIALPQEILRSGRFDAVFFIDLPNRQEREAILKVILEKYDLDKSIKVGEMIIDATENFSGAEIEQSVIETLYKCVDSDVDANEFMLLKIIKGMIPLAVTMEEQISAMRAWCFTRARPASYPEQTNNKKRRLLCHI